MATVTTAVDWWVPGFESGVAVPVLAVLEIFVPDTVSAPTVTVKVNVVLAPEGNEVRVH